MSNFFTTRTYYIIESFSPSAFFKGKSAQCEYTADGVGIIMPAGVNTTNYLGIKFQSLSNLIPNLYGKKLHIKFVCSAEGEDAYKLNWRSLTLYPVGKFNIIADSILYSNEDNYIITDFDIEFPESGTIGDGQFYLNLKTNSNSSPVTIRAIASYYEINDAETAKSFGIPEGMNELTFGIGSIELSVGNIPLSIFSIYHFAASLFAGLLGLVIIGSN